MAITLSNLVIGEYNPGESWVGSVDVAGLTTNYYCKVWGYGKTTGVTALLGSRQNNGTVNLDLTYLLWGEEGYQTQPIVVMAISGASLLNCGAIIAANGLDDIPSVNLPHQPTIDNYQRPPLAGEHAGDANYATLDVSGVDEDETIHADLLDALWLTAWRPFFPINELGSRIGPGELTLDYTLYGSSVLGIIFVQPAFVYAERDGAFSAPAVHFHLYAPLPVGFSYPLGADYGEGAVLSDLHRLEDDPTTLQFTASEMPEGTVWGILYTKPTTPPTLGWSELFTGNGTHTLPDMAVDNQYGLFYGGRTPAYHFIWTIAQEPKPPGLAPNPSITSRRKPEIVRKR